MPITGTITVIAPIAPTSEQDTYPVTIPAYGKGGLRGVADSSSRLSIPLARREQGMMVYEEDTGDYYILYGGVADEYWRKIIILIPDAFGNIHIDGNLIVSGYVETDTGIRGGTDEDLEYLGNGMLMDCGEY
jgi:hypothetical protein